MTLRHLDVAWDPTQERDPNNTELEDADADAEYCWTPLQLASLKGDITTVKQILAETPPPSLPSVVNAPPTGYYGKTALQASCLRGHEEVVRLLLDAGADVHMAGGNNSHRNALENACSAGNMAIVRMLLDHGAQVNPRGGAGSYGGRTPLAAAAERGHVGVVRLLLLGMGADVNAAPSRTYGCTPLQGACSLPPPATSDGDGAGNGDGDGDEGDQKNRVEKRRDVELVELLLDSGADVNAPAGKSRGRTALQSACLAGNMEVVEVLLSRGADVNAPGSAYKGGTALHAACAKGRAEIVRRMLEAGADVNAEAGWHRQTPLQTAAVGGHVEIVEMLRAAGAVGRASGGKVLFW
ncbi:hypothetical protein VMCG_09439 [Cytospora schulzeri]|uniref:Uncharacterized protein n=1 Tax=Cytospora schulzeri TaxID=448051 RepID=A0A423VKH4_9PEZI|nr:hypothetical protein VMCG_09439 [Valsa malicola]